MGYFEYNESEMFKLNKFYDDSKLIEIIEQIIDMSKMVRHEGLLSIEGDINEIEGDFYKIIFQMLMNNVDASVQFDFGLNIIRSTDIDGTELRNMMIYNKGIAMINRGEKPYLVEKILYSMIGKYKFDRRDS